MASEGKRKAGKTVEYELRLYVDVRPSAISVDGKDGVPWRWDGARSMASVQIRARPIRERITVEWR